MSKFFEKYNVVNSSKIITKSSNISTPEERNRAKMINLINDQLVFLDNIICGQEISITEGQKSQKPRLFWQDVRGGFLFTPRFGNDFLFGKDRGISCSTHDELKTLIGDFRSAVENSEFDERINEIASARKGRGAGVPRNRKP
jgi:hypothetical protein